jgi:lipopolysaccharide export system protein LptC
MASHISHNKRTAHRWPLIGLMLGGTFLALGSFWLVQVMQRPDEQGAAAKSSEPDYIVENFSFVRMGPTGQPRFVLSGTRLAHRPDTDVSDIDQPVMRSMTAERPPMTVTANTAHVLNQQNQVNLVGNVVAQRPASPKTQALHVRTEAMTVLPDEDILKTDQAVGIMLGTATLTGVGMEANNATQKLHVASRGQIVYPPRPRK